jgi:hypothetical protein
MWHVWGEKRNLKERLLLGRLKSMREDIIKMESKYELVVRSGLVLGCVGTLW